MVDRRTELGVREALVEWAGEWEDSWVPESFLSKDLRRRAGARRRVRDDTTSDGAALEGGRPETARRTPRLAGEVPGAGLR